MEDRSALFDQLKGFSQRKLKKVETKVVTGTGEQLVEKRGAKGLQVLSGDGNAAGGLEQPARKLDLQVGFILPGLLIGSQDVAHDKSSLESYGITHILNLDSDVENKFEDDYNYKNVAIQDKPNFELDKVLEDCFDFIDDGRHYGNVFVHCSGTIGLSRSTSICVAYLMNKEKQNFTEAFNNVKEARSFVKPNEGFQKQLKEYEVKLRGAQQVKESGIDDPFALRKKQEIEQEKAMVAGAASVKNRMKLFGAQLDTTTNQDSSSRSKSVSPSPYASKSQQSATESTSRPKWSERQQNEVNNNSKLASKSMTPEPRKSWQTSPEKSSSPSSQPPPPPMPASSLYANDKQAKSWQTSSTSSSNKSSLPPPPPPPPPAGLLSDSSSNNKPSKTSKPSSHSTAGDRKASISSTEGGQEKMVFGRRPPPPMKIRGGLSIERQDSTGDRTLVYPATVSKSNQKSSLQLPLKKQFTSDSDGETAGNKTDSIGRAPSPSAALRAAKRGSGASSPTDTTTSNKSGLNRSSTKKLLNLIKTKTRTDLTLPDGDENDEIEALLGALESESIDNIDWDELGLDEDEVKDIIKKGGASSSSSSSSSSEEEEEETDDEDEEEVEEVERSTKHYVIRSK